MVLIEIESENLVENIFLDNESNIKRSLMPEPDEEISSLSLNGFGKTEIVVLSNSSPNPDKLQTLVISRVLWRVSIETLVKERKPEFHVGVTTEGLHVSIVNDI